MSATGSQAGTASRGPGDGVVVTTADTGLAARIESWLCEWGYLPIRAASLADAISRPYQEAPLAVLCDSSHAESFVLHADRRGPLRASTIVWLRRDASVEEESHALRTNADVVHTLPDPQRLRPLLSALADRRSAARARWQQASGGDLIYASEAMRELLRLAGRVAASHAPVLLLGESGTGKERLARTLHDLGPRREGPFVAVSCAAVPATLLESEFFGHERGAFTGAERRRLGCFELASGGTLFLDEIGDMPLELQPKLLRALEAGQITRLGSEHPTPVDVRITSATNRELKADVQQGRFREDLYYRLAVVGMQLPPLRERREDIPVLAEHFLRHYADLEHRSATSFDAAALEVMARHDWPGNVRELRNVVERALIMASGTTVSVKDLPGDLIEERAARMFAAPLGRPLDEILQRYMVETLRAEGGSRRATAKKLGISDRTLYAKLRRERQP